MQRLKNLLRSALKFGKSKIGARFDAICAGLEEQDGLRIFVNAAILVLTFGLSLCVGIILVKLIIRYLHIFIIAVFLAVALYSVVMKFLGEDIGDGSGEDSASIILAEQEAAEIHEDLLMLVYNAVAETSERMPIQRPRDAFSIETSREKPYRMEGSLAIHQFEIDCDREIDHETRNRLIRELQRHINQQSRRFQQLVREGRPPVVYYIKENGNFLLLEIVLYSQKHAEKMEASKRARIEYQNCQERIDDPRYRR